MNHDPTAAADSARLPTRDDSDSGNSESHHHVDLGDASNGGRRVDGRRPRPNQSSRPRRRRSSSRVRRAKAGIARKLDFMTNLMGSLDVLVFAELSVLYYMEYVVLFCTPSPQNVLTITCLSIIVAPSPA